MENESFGQRAKRKTKSFLKKTLIFVIVAGVVFFLFAYFFSYENGVMAGKVVRISKLGAIFKTYEGKLNNETFGALKGTTPFAESYDFSVEGGNESVIKDLEAVSLSGERVNLRYKKVLVRFPWRGNTKTFVTGVERSKE